MGAKRRTAFEQRVAEAKIALFKSIAPRDPDEPDSQPSPEDIVLLSKRCQLIREESLRHNEPGAHTLTEQDLWPEPPPQPDEPQEPDPPHDDPQPRPLPSLPPD